ncbi:MAG: hypothetical protein HY723_00095 [Chloroflexi bacterium]|nr:hypothetical protein [Chloroflexota bacterium]
MDWNELRRNKLAKARFGNEAPPPDKRRPATDWAIEIRERFTALQLWEQAAITAVGFLLVFAVPLIIFAVTRGGGGSDEAANSAPIVPPVQIAESTSTPTATFVQLRTTPTPLQSLPTVEANREDCAAILGTPYQSEAERLWFIANCAVPAEQPAPGDGVPPPQPTLAPPPAPTPTPVQGLTASQAISRAVDWLASQGIGIDAGSCGASSSGSTWTVSCESNTTVCIQQGPIVIWLC